MKFINALRPALLVQAFSKVILDIVFLVPIFILVALYLLICNLLGDAKRVADLKSQIRIAKEQSNFEVTK